MHLPMQLRYVIQGSLTLILGITLALFFLITPQPSLSASPSRFASSGFTQSGFTQSGLTQQQIDQPFAGPSLSIPTTLSASPGGLVDVPVVFQSNGSTVASVAFSLDFDEACLRFDPTDGNQDGQPDVITFHTPSSFTPSISFSAGDSNGELDFTVIDFSAPLEALPADLTLVTIRLRVICTPPTGTTRSAHLRFSTSPPPQFGDTHGRDLSGTATSGQVTIGSTAATATPTPIASATQTPIETVTSTPLPIASPTPLPTATSTATGTLPATVTPTGVPTTTSTATPTAFPTESATATPTGTLLPIDTQTPTLIPTPTQTPTPTLPPGTTPTATLLPILTDTATPTAISSATPASPTATLESTPTASATPVTLPTEEAIPSFTPTHAPPQARDDTASVTENRTVAFVNQVKIDLLANDQSATGGALTLASLATATRGRVVRNADQTVTYYPNLGQVGEDSFAYTILDADGNEASAVVRVQIVNKNDRPSVVDDQASTDEEVALTLDPLANDSDPENDALQLISVTQGRYGTAQMQNNRTIRYTPRFNAIGTDNLVYTVDDGKGAQASGQVLITIRPIEDAATGVEDAAVTNANTAVTLNPLANDFDSDSEGKPLPATLQITHVSDPPHGSAQFNADGTITYQPDANFRGTDSFVYTFTTNLRFSLRTPIDQLASLPAADNMIGALITSTAAATVTVIVAPQSGLVQAQPDVASTNEETAQRIDVLRNDSVQSGQLRLIGLTPATGHVAINSNQSLSYLPPTDFQGIDVVTYTVSDGGRGVANGVVTITVVGVNDPPLTQPDVVTTSEESLMRFNPLSNDRDPDGDSLHLQSITQPDFGSIESSTLPLSFTPQQNFSGEMRVAYQVNDGKGGENVGLVNLSVQDVNDLPVANHDVALTDEDTPVLIDPLVNDLEFDLGDKISVQLVGSAEHGQAVRTEDGKVRYTPAHDYAGTDSVGYVIADGRSGVAVAQIKLYIHAINDPPTLQTPGDQQHRTGEAISLTVTASDVDSNLLIFSATGLPSGLQISQRSGRIQGLLTAESAGDYRVTVAVSDGEQRSEVSFTWKVTATPSFPYRQFLPIAGR